jgi:hypothetical protein
MTNVSAQKPSRTTYDAIITACRPAIHEKGYGMINWQFEVTSGIDMGLQMTDTSHFSTEKAKEYFIKTCETLGVPYDPKQEKLSQKCAQIEGKRIKLDVVYRPSTYIVGLLEETPVEDDDFPDMEVTNIDEIYF